MSSEISINVSFEAQSNALGCPAFISKTISDYPFIMPSPYAEGVAIHRSQDYLAYAINKSSGSSAGLVRVMHFSSTKRCLIKEAKGLIADMAFAWVTHTILLAFVDTLGNCFLYKIQNLDNEKNLNVEKVLVVYNNSSNGGIAHKVCWCRYVPEGSEDQIQDDPLLLAVTLQNSVQLWQVASILNSSGTEVDSLSVFQHEALAGCYELGSAVTCVAVSPDSTCIALAGADGIIKFYQVS